MQPLSPSVPTEHRATQHRTLQGSDHLQAVLTSSLSGSLDSNDLHIHQNSLRIFIHGLVGDKSVERPSGDYCIVLCY